MSEIAIYEKEPHPRHLPSVAGDKRRRRATVLLFCPAAHPSTMRARRAALRSGAGPSSQRFELLPFGLGQNDGNRWASRSHATSLSGENGVAQHYTLSSGTGH